MSRTPFALVLAVLLAIPCACTQQDPKGNPGEGSENKATASGGSVGSDGSGAKATAGAPTGDGQSSAKPSGANPSSANPSGANPSGAEGNPGVVPAGAAEGSAGVTKATEKTPSTETPKTESAVIVFDPAKAVPGGAAVDDPWLGIEKLSPDAQAVAKELKALRSRIPVLFVDLKHSLTDLDSDLQKAAVLGLEFTAKWGDSPQAAYVHAMLGRDLLSRIQRHLQAYKAVTQNELQKAGLNPSELKSELSTLLVAEKERFLSAVRKNSDLALSKAKTGTTGHYHALALRADLAEKDYAFRDVVEWSRKILEIYPKAQYRSKHLIDIGKGFFLQRRYQDSANFMKWVVANNKDDIEYVGYVNLLFEALTGVGDLDGMESLLRSMKSEFAERAKKTLPLSRHYGTQYQQWYDIADFWIGFVHYARGDADKALESFQASLVYLNDLDKKLQAEGKSLPSVQKVVRDFRVEDLIKFLTEYHGKLPRVSQACGDAIAAADLTSGVEWVTDNKLTLDQALGQVVPVLFRLPQNKRAETFFEELNLLGETMPDVSPICMGFLPSKVTPAQKNTRYQKMRADIGLLGITMPVGYDVSPNQCVLRSVHATVGSASFMIFDKQGRIAWYLPDPRDMDRAILKKVLERLAKD